MCDCLYVCVDHKGISGQRARVGETNGKECVVRLAKKVGRTLFVPCVCVCGDGMDSNWIDPTVHKGGEGESTQQKKDI
jgi:hypothetical protein